jgi:glycosyltransferase involved in cell wall biosynthesis
MTAMPAAAETTKRRIVFVINSLGPGGAERVMTTVLENAPRDSWDVHLVLLDRDAEHRTPPDFVTVHRLDCGGRLLPSINALRHELKRLAPDLVVSFLVRANVAAVIAANGIGAPVVISERAQLSTHLTGRHGYVRALAAKLVPRLVYPRADHIIAVSGGVRQDLIAKFGVRPECVSSIPNPYDVPGIAAAAADAPEFPLPDRFIVSAGRLTESKGFADLIDAYAQTQTALPLVILGEGDLREALQARITAAKLNGHVILADYARNPFAIVGRAEMFVSASHCEGFPNAMAEAMALGVPVVATDCPSGPAELLDEVETTGTTGIHAARHGMLTAVGDAPALAEAMKQMLTPATLAHYRRQSRIRIADFNVARAMERYWSCFAATLDGNTAVTKGEAPPPVERAPEPASVSG